MTNFLFEIMFFLFFTGIQFFIVKQPELRLSLKRVYGWIIFVVVVKFPQITKDISSLVHERSKTGGTQQLCSSREEQSVEFSFVVLEKFILPSNSI